MIALWLGVALAGPPGPDAMLRAGQYRLVAAGATQILDERPDDLQAKSWLAQAQAGLERCASVERLVAELRPTVQWSPGLAVAEGRCAALRGEWSLAEAAFEEAVRMDPDHVRGWVGLGEAAAARGDSEALARALEGLEAQQVAPHAERMLRASIAQEYALDPMLELVLFDRELDWQRHRPTATSSLALVDGLEWLRVGDPERAYERFASAMSAQYAAPELGAWLGEAARRLGWDERVDAIFEEGRLARTPRVDVRLLRARWLIDRGELDEARVVLEETEGLRAPLWVGTRWYLARAAGESTQVWEQAWREQPPGYGSLADLVPL
ncbi:MAG: hypothetical protein EP330_12255 [Deltaproteobacteria bacterium]|nr:MAG: hypothetical protein EP330_12255 [Deltaproteobacteria bacterium]